MRCCFVAEMAHALLVLLIIRLLFIITALQMALLVCLVPLLQMVCAAGYLLVISAYWQFCAEWQDRPGIITLEIMRAPRADTGQWSS